MLTRVPSPHTGDGGEASLAAQELVNQARNDAVRTWLRCEYPDYCTTHLFQVHYRRLGVRRGCKFGGDACRFSHTAPPDFEGRRAELDALRDSIDAV